MTVRKYVEGDEVEEGCIAVQASYQVLDAIRLVFIDDEDWHVSYVVHKGVRPVDDPDPRSKELMKASGATSVNLWYKIHESGMDLVSDLDTVRDLEAALMHCEEEKRRSLN